MLKRKKRVKENCDERTARLLKAQQVKYNAVMNTDDQLDVLNDFIKQSAEILSCGPECQREKQKLSLLTQYDMAQRSLTEGPDNLEDTAKTYYTFADGEEYYDEFSDEKYREVANKIGNEYESVFNDLSETTRHLISLSRNHAKNVDENQNYANELENQTIDTERKIRATASDMTTGERKAFYTDQEMENLRQWYNIFYYLYIVVLIAFFVCAFVVKYAPPFRSVMIRFFVLLAWFFLGHYVVVRLVRGMNDAIDLIPKNAYLQD
jgi:hypothetical protein